MQNGYKNTVFTSGAVVYKDFDISFKSNPTTGDLRTKTNEDAIKQSLLTLVYTNFGERPFRPELYGGITDLLFEPMDQVSKLILEDRLVQLFSNWEPRIEIISLETNDINYDRGELLIVLKYNVLNIQGPQELELLIKRLR